MDDPRVSVLGRHPHAAARAVLLEVEFIQAPQFKVVPFRQPAQFFKRRDPKSAQFSVEIDKCPTRYRFDVNWEPKTRVCPCVLFSAMVCTDIGLSLISPRVSMPRPGAR